MHACADAVIGRLQQNYLCRSVTRYAAERQHLSSAAIGSHGLAYDVRDCAGIGSSQPTQPAETGNSSEAAVSSVHVCCSRVYLISVV